MLSTQRMRTEICLTSHVSMAVMAAEMKVPQTVETAEAEALENHKMTEAEAESRVENTMDMVVVEQNKFDPIHLKTTDSPDCLNEPHDSPHIRTFDPYTDSSCAIVEPYIDFVG